MLKVLKYLKKTWVAVIFIIILLCVQATADLNLPDYTSKIVNTGIQSGGIEVAVPDVISEQDMEILLLFTDNKDDILNNYTFIQSEDEVNDNYQEKVIKKYLEENEFEDLYVINDITDEQKNELAKKMVNPLMDFSVINNDETANQIKEQMLANVPDQQKQMLQEQDLIEIIKNMPETQQKELLEEFTKQIDSMEETIKEQGAVASVREVYKNAGVDTDKIQNNYILITGFQMLGVALISMISAVSIMFLSSRVAARLGRTLREKVFKKVLSFSNKELSEFSTASLITRSTNDIQQIQQLITMLFRVVVYAPIIGIGGLVKVLTSADNSLAWIIGVAIIAILFIVGTLFIIAMPRFKKLQDLTDKLNAVSREILTGIPVIRAFNTEKKEEDRFDKANKNLMKTNILVNRAMSMMMPMLMFVMNTMAILVVWFGGHNVEQGIMQVGDMMAFIQYMMQIVMAFLMISMISIMLPRASVSANRINEVLETNPDIKDPEEAETKQFDPNKKGLVEFKNVCFRYPDADTEILEDINFTAKSRRNNCNYW